MALTQVSDDATALATDLNQIIQHVQGQAGSTEAWFFRCSTGNNYVVRLSDNAGARKFTIQDSDGNEVASINSDGTLTAVGLTLTGNLILPVSTAPAQTTEGAAAWDSDDDLLTVGTGAAMKVIGLKRGAGLSATATAELAYDTTDAALKAWNGSASVLIGPPMAGLVIESRDSKALLALFNGAGYVAATAATAPLPIGFVAIGGGTSGNIAAPATALAGGGVLLSTGTTSGGNIIFRGGAGKAVRPDKNPYGFCQMVGGAGNAALLNKFVGFHSETAVTNFTTTTAPKVGFRCTTTSNWIFVTGNGTAEQTTDTLIAQDATTSRLFEWYTTDSGVTWIGKIDGAVVGTHTTQVPVTTTVLMNPTAGIQNNTTTDVQITNFQRYGAYQSI